MTEQAKSKAQLAREELMTPGSRDAAYRSPESIDVQLRADAPTVEIDETTPARSLVDQLRADSVDLIAMHEPNVGVTAVVVPVERYLALVSKELETSEHIGVSGKLIPTDAAFAASYVEPIDSGRS